jgi:membrane protein YdbS with pleckstrin-like domain
MYAPLRQLVLRVLRAPGEAPEAPAGSHASVQVFRASPRYLRYRLLVWAIASSVVAVALAIAIAATAIAQEWLALALVALGGMLAACAIFLTYFVVRIEYEVRYYVVTDRSLRVREGAWTVREMTLTYANVQNLRVTQGPLQRLFGFSNLRVDTAGGGGVQSAKHSGGGRGHSVTVAGVENAVELRDLVLAHLRARGAGTGLGDPDDERAAAARGQPFGGPRVAEALRAIAAEARALAAAARSRVG